MSRDISASQQVRQSVEPRLQLGTTQAGVRAQRYQAMVNSVQWKSKPDWPLLTSALTPDLQTARAAPHLHLPHSAGQAEEHHAAQLEDSWAQEVRGWCRHRARLIPDLARGWLRASPRLCQSQVRRKTGELRARDESLSNELFTTWVQPRAI